MHSGLLRPRAEASISYPSSQLFALTHQPLAPGAQEEEVQARPVFPFTAIVGQEQMKLALMLNIIDPKIGGVMVMGDRGTGKSTTVRALTDLLPEIRVRVAWNHARCDVHCAC